MTPTPQQQIDDLNKTVFCRLGPSKIHGIGVIAIRDIPEGTRITDYSIHKLTKVGYCRKCKKIYSLKQS